MEDEPRRQVERSEIEGADALIQSREATVDGGVRHEDPIRIEIVVMQQAVAREPGEGHDGGRPPGRGSDGRPQPKPRRRREELRSVLERQVVDGDDRRDARDRWRDVLHVQELRAGLACPDRQVEQETANASPRAEGAQVRDVAARATRVPRGEGPGSPRVEEHRQLDVVACREGIPEPDDVRLVARLAPPDDVGIEADPHQRTGYHPLTDHAGRTGRITVCPCPPR